MTKRIIITLIVSVLLIICLMNIFHGGGRQKFCVHTDLNNDAICDECKSALPFGKLEADKLVEATTSDNNLISVFGKMPQETDLKISDINMEEATELAQKYAKVPKEDVLYAYDISLSSKNIKYQPREYSQKVRVDISNVNIDMNKEYAMLHIMEDGEYELLPVNKISSNEICFNATSFSTYILITVAGYDIKFEGENFGIYDTYGSEITNGTTIASGTDLVINVVPDYGYGIVSVTCTDSTVTITDSDDGKTVTIPSVTSALSVVVTTMDAPSITTHPAPAKVLLGEKATFSVVTEGSVKYKWQYKASQDVETWSDVTSTIGTSNTVASGYTTATLTIDTSYMEYDEENLTITNSLSGYLFRCVVSNSSYSSVVSYSDIALLSVTQDTSVLNNVKVISEATLDIESAAIVEVGSSKNLDFDYVGDGTLSVAPADSTIATATISGSTLIINGKKIGTTVLTITGTEGASYSPVEKTVTVTVIETGSELITEWTIPQDADGSGLGTTVKLPIPAADSNSYTVDWGDGTVENYTGTIAFPTHNYLAADTYTIKVAGTVSQFGNIGRDEITEDSDYYTFTKYVTKLVDWGDVEATAYGFAQCTNLSGEIPTPLEDSFKNVTSFEYLFYNCSKLTSFPADLFDTATNLVASSTGDGFRLTFAYCLGFTEIEIDTPYIGYQMFYGCNNLTDITIGNNVTLMATDSFYATDPYSLRNPLITNLTSTNQVAYDYDWVRDNRAQRMAIITEPQDVSTELNKQVTFTVVADGNDLKYRWYEVEDDIASILDATTPTLTLSASEVVASKNENRYYCEVYNSFGTLTSREALLTITNIPQATVTATGYTGTYDGQAHGITLSGTNLTGATVTYGTTAGNYTLTTAPTFTDAGTYTVYFKVEKDNYITYRSSAKVIINPKSISIAWENVDLTYSGKEQAPVAKINTGISNETVVVSVSGSAIDAGDYEATAKIVSVDGGRGRINNYVLEKDT